MADFRTQQEYLRVDDGAFTKGLLDRTLKSEKKRFLSSNRYIHITLFFIVVVFALVTAQVGWMLFGQEPDGIPIFRSATKDSGYFNALESPVADQLEEHTFGSNKNLEKPSSMTTDLASRQVAADELDARISGLTGKMETLNSLTTDLESRQVAADRLEERISKITKDLQILSNLAAGVEAKQRAALATTTTVVPATQKPVSRTTEQPTVAKETPASVPQSRPWTINLISSPDKTYAVNFSDTAQSRGISTELQEASVKGTPYWRVQVTGFLTQDEAKTAADSVKDKLGLTDIWIMKR